MWREFKDVVWPGMNKRQRFLFVISSPLLLLGAVGRFLWGFLEAGGIIGEHWSDVMKEWAK